MAYLEPRAVTRHVVNPLVSRLQTGGVATLTVPGRSARCAMCRWSACPAAPARGRRSTPPAPRPGSPRIVFEASAPPMVVQMAARDLGLAVVPASTANGPQTLRTRTLQITSSQVRSRERLELRAVREPRHAGPHRAR